MKVIFNTSGLLNYACVIPYGTIIIIIAITYFKFMMRLPKPILKRFIVAGILFVFGAVSMEILSGMHLEKYGNKTLTNTLMYSFEELLEMSGSVVFLYALVSYIQLKFNTFLIAFGTHEGDTKDERQTVVLFIFYKHKKLYVLMLKGSYFVMKLLSQYSPKLSLKIRL